MSKLILWKNQEMAKFKRDMDQLFERCWSSFGIDSMFSEWGAGPHIDMLDRGDTLEVNVYLPGFRAEELDVSIAGNRLAIKAELQNRINRQRGNVRHLRSRLGSLSRVVPLPCRVDADRTSANFKNGVLSISMPKKETDLNGGVKIEVG
jgi:HSP20 family protein